MKKLLLFFGLTLLGVFSLNAQCLMYPVLLSERVPQSSLIIEGKVINQQSFWNADYSHIYTSNLVEVYKNFKSSSPAYIEVITQGGIIGNNKETVEPSLELNIGDVGVFTLISNNEASQFGKQVYETYAVAQGFIKYDIANDVASEPFNKYPNASSTLYNTIAQFTGTTFSVVKPINPFQPATPIINSIQAIAAITSFTPTSITAGTYSVLTINGSGFGATTGTVSFKNADDGGATFIDAIPTEVVFWSATQVQVKVPSKAGTGVIRVNGVNSTQTLTIPYSHLNVTNSGYKYYTRHVNKQSGGYVWTYNTNFNANAPAKAAFERSLQSWRCATYINWTLSGTTSTVNAAAGGDGVNIVTFNPSLGAGILGNCYSYWSGCGTAPNMNWYVTELDIQFANNPSSGSFTWQYGPAAPTASQYDFESVTVHELGHGHQLGHVINSSDLMHYAVSNGQTKRNLNSDDLNGGLAVMTRNATAAICSQTNMTPLTAGNCALGAPSASFTANRTTVCPGQTVIFTNLSTGSPTANAWVFAGGTPSISSVTNPTVTYNTPGTYSVSLTASNSNGSNTYSVVNYITVSSASALPLVEGFQSAMFPPTNWSVVDGGNDGVKWQLSTAAGQASSQSAVFDNWTTDVSGTRDELKTFVNLSGFTSAKMTFYRAYGATYSAPNIDSLEIRVSTNCGTTSNQAYYKGGSQIGTGAGTGTALYVPASNVWVKDSIDLTPYVGNASVMISFVNRSWYGDGMYLDNINITGVGPTAPTATINSVSTACTGQSIALTATTSGTPTSYLWTMAGGTPTTAATASTSVTYSAAGVYTVSLTVANATGTTTATKSITITATPTVVPSYTNTTICAGSSTTLTLAGATSYTWLPSGSGSSSVLSPTATTVYSITGSSGACVSAVRTVTVNVNASPVLTITPASLAICSGQNAVFTASGATTYSWSTGASTNSISVSPTLTTVYTATGTTAGCSSAKSVTLTVNALPVTVASTSGTLTCTATTVNVNSSLAGMNYTWTAPAGGSALTPNAQNTAVTGAGTYTIKVVNPSTGCTYSTTTSVTQNTTTPTGVSAGSNQTLTCSSSSVTLNGSVTTPTNATASWTGASVCGSSTSFVSAACAAGVYTLTATNPASGCKATSTVQVFPSSGAPSVATSVSGTITCTSPNVQVVASTTTTPVSYSWTGPGIVSGAGTASATVNAAGQYTVVVTNTSSGCSSSSMVTVSQNTVTPSVVSSATGTLSCTTNTVKVIATTTTSPVSYAWAGPGIVSGATTASATVNQPGSYNYTVTNTSNGCIKTGTQAVIQNTVSPVVSSSTTGTLTCSTTSVNVIASTATSPVSYAWTGPGIISGAGTGTISVNMPGSYNYTVINTANGCSTTGSQAVLQNTVAPTGVSAGSNATLSCSSSSVTLNGSVTTPTNATASWTGASVCGSSTSFVSAACAAGVYTLTATNPANGCKASATVQVFASSGAPVVTNNPVTNSITCANSTVSVSISTTATPVTYAWSGTGITSGAGTSNITVNQAGVFGYTVTNTSNGCSTTGSQTVASNTVAPTFTLSPLSSTICSGNSQVLTVTTATSNTKAWSTGATTSTISVTPTVTTSYTVTVTSAINGCSSFGVTTVNVTTAPVVSVSPSNTTICSGTSVSLVASGASSYTWSPSGSGATNVVSPGATTVYTVTGSTGSCAGVPVSATVNVIASPTLVATTSNTLICTGFSSTLTANGNATSYVWTPSSSLSSSTGSVVTASPTITTTYTVTGTSGSCSTAATVVQNVSLCTGIDALTVSAEAMVFPNPSNGQFTLAYGSNVEEVTIEIMNTIGQTVKVITAYNVTELGVDLTKMAKGVYYLKASTKEGSKLFKLILE